VSFANATGAWWGLAASIFAAVFIAYGRELDVPEHLQLSFTWMMPASLLLGITTGALVSLLTSSSIHPHPPTPPAESNTP
jgi:drug/metabolite transporter (DMT)-like permease